MSLDPKVFQKLHLGQIKNNKITLKTWKGGSNEAERKGFERNIEKGYQKPLGHPLIL